MAEIFVSYRYDDSKHLAGRLGERLRERFGDARVFRDRNSIAPGEDFAEVIERDLGRCRVMLVVIGSRWLQAVDDTGRLKLDDPGDYVRLEVGTALKRGITTIPVLADGARLPSAEELPRELAALPGKQTQRVGEDSFKSDVAQLIELLEKKYRVLPPAKEWALAFVRGLCAFIGVLLLASNTWPGCVEAAMAFGLGAVLSLQPRHDWVRK